MFSVTSGWRPVRTWPHRGYIKTKTRRVPMAMVSAGPCTGSRWHRGSVRTAQAILPPSVKCPQGWRFHGVLPNVGRPNASWSSCGVLCDFKIKAKFLFLSIKYWKRHECGLCCMLVHCFKFEKCVTFLSRDMNQWMWLRALFCNTGLCAVSDVQINLGWWHRELNTSVALCSLCWDGAAKL